MAEIFLLLLVNVIGIALCAWVVRFDERFLSEQELGRAWPRASYLIAVVVFAPWSLPIHFVRTRRSVMGLLLGLVVLSLVLTVQLGVGWAFESLFAAVSGE